eukprot:TRINITY_DN1000_c2_g2_i1.p1 TRINITY_DN1000_c2_g2~~TRINITY_DN1000_c2_g2_i1.p1  ORF type:complete len:1033 (+),score=300.78 TRINITY_DN1000_c2_g2_i1:19-3117(+)
MKRDVMQNPDVPKYIIGLLLGIILYSQVSQTEFADWSIIWFSKLCRGIDQVLEVLSWEQFFIISACWAVLLVFIYYGCVKKTTKVQTKRKRPPGKLPKSRKKRATSHRKRSASKSNTSSSSSFIPKKDIEPITIKLDPNPVNDDFDVDDLKKILPKTQVVNKPKRGRSGSHVHNAENGTSLSITRRRRKSHGNSNVINPSISSTTSSIVSSRGANVPLGKSTTSIVSSTTLSTESGSNTKSTKSISASSKKTSSVISNNNNNNNSTAKMITKTSTNSKTVAVKENVSKTLKEIRSVSTSAKPSKNSRPPVAPPFIKSKSSKSVVGSSLSSGLSSHLNKTKSFTSSNNHKIAVHSSKHSTTRPRSTSNASIKSNGSETRHNPLSTSQKTIDYTKTSRVTPKMSYASAAALKSPATSKLVKNSGIQKVSTVESSSIKHKPSSNKHRNSSNNNNNNKNDISVRDLISALGISHSGTVPRQNEPQHNQYHHLQRQQQQLQQQLQQQQELRHITLDPSMVGATTKSGMSLSSLEEMLLRESIRDPIPRRNTSQLPETEVMASMSTTSSLENSIKEDILRMTGGSYPHQERTITMNHLHNNNNNSPNRHFIPTSPNMSPSQLSATVSRSPTLSGSVAPTFSASVIPIGDNIHHYENQSYGPDTNVFELMQNRFNNNNNNENSHLEEARLKQQLQQLHDDISLISNQHRNHQHLMEYEHMKHPHNHHHHHQQPFINHGSSGGVNLGEMHGFMGSASGSLVTGGNPSVMYNHHHHHHHHQHSHDLDSQHRQIQNLQRMEQQEQLEHKHHQHLLAMMNPTHGVESGGVDGDWPSMFSRPSSSHSHSNKGTKLSISDIDSQHSHTSKDFELPTPSERQRRLTHDEDELYDSLLLPPPDEPLSSLTPSSSYGRLEGLGGTPSSVSSVNPTIVNNLSKNGFISPFDSVIEDDDEEFMMEGDSNKSVNRGDGGSTVVSSNNTPMMRNIHKVISTPTNNSTPSSSSSSSATNKLGDKKANIEVQSPLNVDSQDDAEWDNMLQNWLN